MVQLYELAYLLHQPLGVILDMPYDEMLGWFQYFERRPVGWREDNRAVKILQSNGVKAKPSDIFSSLAVIQSSSSPQVVDGQISVEDLKKSKVFSFMSSAEGGDKLDI